MAALDTFTGANGVLSGHTSDSGHSWTDVGNAPRILSNAITPGTTNNSYANAVISWTPASADYEVSATCVEEGTAPNTSCMIGVVARCTDSANYYALRHVKSTDRWEIIRRAANTVTVLDTLSEALSSTPIPIKLRVTGTGATVSIRWWVNDVEQDQYSDTDATRLTSTGSAGILFYERASDVNGYRLDGFGADVLAASSPTPAITSATIDATGLALTIVFESAVTYYAGLPVLSASPLIGQSAQRTISCTSLTSGDGTDTLVFALRDGKPVCENETGVTVDIPSGMVGTTAVSDTAVTNSSEVTCKPSVQIVLKKDDFYTGTIDLEAVANGIFGVSGVALSITDGSTTIGPTTVTSRSASAYDSWPVYKLSANLATLADGQCTITATATSNVTGSTRETTCTIYNNSGGTLTSMTKYVAGTSGNDTTGDGDSPETAYATCSKAVEVARLASAAHLIIEIVEAGTYTDWDSAYTGFDFTGARGITVQIASGLTAADVVMRGCDPNATTRTRLSGVTVDVRVVGDDEEVLAQTALTYDECVITSGHCGLVGTATWSWGVAGADLWGCTVEDIISGPLGARLVRNTTVRRNAGDFCTNLTGAAINCVSEKRAWGRPVLSLVCATSGATAAKSGDVITLVDSVNGTTDLDLTNASYDTTAELVAAIDALTGWSATAIDTVANAATAADWSEADATVERTIYGNYGPHSDLMQWFGDTTYTGVVVEGIRGVPFDAADYWGMSTDVQNFWIDHAGPSVIDGMSIVGVSDPTFAVSGDARSGIHPTLTDVLIAHVSCPHTPLSFINGGGAGTALIPTNVVLAYSIFESMAFEDADWETNPVDVDEVYYQSLHLGTAGSWGGYDDDLTSGAVSGVFVSLDVDSLDMGPAGDALGRIPLATGLVSANGYVSGANSSIGAYSVAAATVTTTAASSVTQTSAVVPGTATANGSPVTDRGVCWNTTGSPVYTGPNMDLEAVEGELSPTISNLLPSTKYYVRHWADSPEGLTYSDEITFTTLEEEENPSAPSRMVTASGSDLDGASASSFVFDRLVQKAAIVSLPSYTGRLFVKINSATPASATNWDAILGPGASLAINDHRVRSVSIFGTVAATYGADFNVRGFKS